MRVLASFLAGLAVIGSVCPVAAEPAVVYLRREGGTYGPGITDARADTSALAPRTVVFPPWSPSQEAWSYLLECVADTFAPFDVVVTDVDPGAEPHHEVVIGGDPTQLGQANNILGLAMYPGDCIEMPNSVVFVFADQITRLVPDAPLRRTCEVVAQEIGHSFGLDHVLMCADPMTYLTDCDQKRFQDLEAPCGAFAAGPCYCGGSTQNSFATLMERIGPNPEPADEDEGAVTAGCSAAGTAGGGGILTALLILAAGARAGRRDRARSSLDARRTSLPAKT